MDASSLPVNLSQSVGALHALHRQAAAVRHHHRRSLLDQALPLDRSLAEMMAAAGISLLRTAAGVLVVLKPEPDSSGFSCWTSKEAR